jgi:Uma2 family endonuclease
MRDLLLVAEVLSPSSVRGDRFTKRHLFQERRVPAYWVVDGDDRVVEVWTPDADVPAIERQRLVWHPVGAVRPFTMELGDLFRPI